MCRLTGVNKDSRILDECCGSGSFLVQAMVKVLADCRRGHTEEEYNALADEVKANHIFGIEFPESDTNTSVMWRKLSEQRTV